MKKLGFLALLMMAPFQLAAELVCAIVKIEIRQELSFERQAFDAKMVITNNLDIIDLENLEINVSFVDNNGNPILASSDPDNINASFFIRIDSMVNVNNVDGSGVINAGNAAEIHWLIIPAPGAGGLTPSGKRYGVGATVSYTFGEESQTLNVVPDYITVRPTPLLKLDYFLPTDVFGDNPLTEEVEAIEPFDLGLRISNTGAGFADQLKIESAQPVITDNDQGLLIDFELLGTSVNDAPVTNSLLADIGLLEAGKSAMVSWVMQSSLNGEFISFEADFYHSDELGGQLTSLIDAPIDTHILFHKVKVDYAGRDSITDFLAYDEDVLRVYESNGGQAQVIDETSSTSVSNLGVVNGKQKYQVNFTPIVGAGFIRWNDPYNGVRQQLTAFRSDGKLLLNNNVWQYRIETDPGVFEYYFGLFDVDSTGQYEITINGSEPNVAPVIVVTTPQVVEAGNQLLFDIQVTDANSGDVLTLVSIGAPAASSVSAVSGSTWNFSWFPQVADIGTYDFILKASDGRLESTTPIQVQVTAPATNDTDNDGMDDDWERLYFGDLDEDGESDFDLDSATNLEEHDFGGNPTLEDRPNAPEIVTPNSGGIVASSVDEMSVINSVAADDANLSYQFELYESQLTKAPLATASIDETSIQTSWLHAQTLLEDTYYIWRVRAFDGVTPSVWSYDSFKLSSSNDAPIYCATDFPADSGVHGVLTDAILIAQTRPSLSIITAQDLDSESLEYRFGLYNDVGLSDLVLQSSWVSSMENTLSWKPYFDLTQGNTYYWTAEVRDSNSTQNCGSNSFTIDTAIIRPSGFSIQSPSVNQLTDLTLDMVVSHDPNANNAANYSYYFELDEVRDFSSIAKQQVSGLTADVSNNVTWSVNGLIENTSYYWRALAYDSEHQGQWVYGQFTTDSLLQGTDIVVKNPSATSWVSSLTPKLEFVLDKKYNDVTNYVLEIYSDSAATNLISSNLVNEEFFITPTLTDREYYYWQVKATMEDATETHLTPLQQFYTIDDQVNEAPLFEFVSLINPEENKSKFYPIQWLDDDNDSDAQISLYYDLDATGADGVLIVENLSEDSSLDSYLWDTSVLNEDSYYIYAVITDGESSSTVYSQNSLFVQHYNLNIQASSTTTSELGGVVTVDVSLTKAPNGYVAIPLTISDLSEASLDQQDMVFTPSNWFTTQQITVTGVDDLEVDGDQPYQLQFGVIDSIDENYQQLTIPAIDLINIDDEAITNNDKQALEALYNSTDGANWTDNTNWLVGEPCQDDWYGVTCDVSDTFVTQIVLANNNLIGTIPSEIGDISSLVYIEMGSNSITGTIPVELYDLSQLTTLKLYNNLLSGELSEELSQLTMLSNLQLYGNSFSGIIPSEIGGLSHLEYLYLNNNQLTGSIPDSIGNLLNLLSVNLSVNQLTGSIPTTIGNLQQLKTLYLTENDLTGEIPVEITQLIGLEQLQIENSALTGSIPPQIGLMQSLFNLNLAGNLLSGSIPAELGSIESLLYLDLGANNLTGEIPEEFSGLTQLIALKLYNNNLSGGFPVELGLLTQLNNLQLQGNELTGNIPTEIGNLTQLEYLFLNNNHLIGEIPSSIGNLLNIKYLHLQGNKLAGELPLEMENLIDIQVNELTLSWNSLSTNNTSLDSFLDSKQSGGDWSITQTIAPENLQISNITNSSLDLSWDAIEYQSNEGRYGIYYAIAGTNDYALAGSTLNKATTFYNVAGLDTVNFNYDFKITTETDSHSGNQNDLISDYSQIISSNTIIDPQPSDDRLALEALYNSTDGSNWTNNSNWLIGDPCADNWFGISCNSTQTKVTRIQLQNNNLTGVIPAELGNLDQLVYLYLHKNNLTSNIPSELGSLANLERLYLQNNLLNGEIPSELGQLTLLLQLQLHANELSGSIPASLGNLLNLTHLYLNNNLFSGNLPLELGNLVQLNYLYLNNNEISGSLPPELGNLTSLINLYLHNNLLTGVIPQEFGNMTLLSRLFLQNNQLDGNIPAEIGGLINLTRMVLSKNSLSGMIPAELGNLSQLTHLQLENNSLSGAIAAEIGNLPQLTHLYLNNNQLSGSLPNEIGLLVNLVNLYAHNNQLSGSLPLSIGNLNNLDRLYLQNNQFTGTLPLELGNLSHLRHLLLSSNYFTGEIPASIGNIATLTSLQLQNNQLTGAIPSSLGNLSLLTHLYLYDNQLSGSIPMELSGMSSLLYMYLYQNKLEGPIPSGFSVLNNLSRMYLQGNQLSGEVPSDLSTLIDLNLTKFDIRYNKLFTADLVLDAKLDTVQTGGDWSSTQTIAPQNLIIDSTTPNSVKLTWDAIEYSSHIGRYNVYIAESGSNSFNLVGSTINKSDTTYSVNGLDTTIISYDFKLVSQTDPHNNNQSQLDSDYSAIVSSQIDSSNDIYEALLALYNSTGGPNWTHNENWLSGDPCINEWYGVVCDSSDTAIVRLSLNSNNLVGSIPAEIGQLTDLVYLYLNNNNLVGNIPSEIGQLFRLDRLYLQSNDLTGSLPNEIGNLINLQRLQANSNLLTGSVPDSIGGLSRLTHLQLNHNEFNGNIPSTIGQLSQLNYLYLHNNLLTGSIPLEIGDSTALINLYLHNNQLSGDLPSTLGQLINLSRLYLQNNQITGAIPTEITGLNSLTQMYLNKNQISGNIPSEIGQLVQLTHLQLNDNLITGTIPLEIGNLTQLINLYFYNNQLSGVIPEQITQLSQLNNLYLHNNQLVGAIPNNIGNLVNLTRLYLHNNQLDGIIPTQIGNLSNLNHLLLYNNNLVGDLPATIGNLSALISAQLHNNNISGNLPSSLGQLTELKTLYLHNNAIDGEIPTELGGLTNIIKMYLNNNKISGQIPLTFGNLASLDRLYLQGNQLQGEIPDELGNLVDLSLTKLDLRYNKLLTLNSALDNKLDTVQLGGNWSATQTVPPLNLVVEESTSDTVTINWDPIEYRSNIGRYGIYSSIFGSENYSLVGTTSNKNASTFSVNSLDTQINRYSFKVVTETDVHNNNQSQLISEFSSVISTELDPTTPLDELLSEIDYSISSLEGLRVDITSGQYSGDFSDLSLFADADLMASIDNANTKYSHISRSNFLDRNDLVLASVIPLHDSGSGAEAFNTEGYARFVFIGPGTVNIAYQNGTSDTRVFADELYTFSIDAAAVTTWSSGKLFMDLYPEVAMNSSSQGDYWLYLPQFTDSEVEIFSDNTMTVKDGSLSLDVQPGIATTGLNVGQLHVQDLNISGNISSGNANRYLSPYSNIALMPKEIAISDGLNYEDLSSMVWSSQDLVLEYLDKTIKKLKQHRKAVFYYQYQ